MNCKSQIQVKLNLSAAVPSLLVLFSPGLSHAQITPSGDSYTNTADAAINYALRSLLGYFVGMELAFAILVALAYATVLTLIGIYISNQGAKSEGPQTCRQKRTTLDLDQLPITSRQPSLTATSGGGAISMNYKARLATKNLIPVAVLGLLLLFWSSLSFGQITPSGDSYTNTADPTTNYGAQTLLYVGGASQIVYLQFPLSSIPSATSVSQATLKLYVNSVATAGSFNVDYVNGAWSESTIDSSNAPPLGSNIAANVDVTTADKNQYILINVTPAVQAWLSGSETNNGFALVANSTFSATFDSKENTTTSHPPELDIAYASAGGTITGVSTASGSGLTGGGARGTLNLSLTKACAASQVLQWSGSKWACSSAGTGTITGVTAGAGLTGGGATGAVSLNLDPTKVPLLASNNAFTGNNSFTSSTTGGTGVLANAGSSTASNGVIAYGATGVAGYATVANSIALFGDAGTNGGTGVYGTGGSYGVYGTVGASGIDGVHGESGSSLHAGVSGLNQSTGYGVYGWASNGYGIFGTVPSTGTDGVHGETSSENSGVAGLNSNSTSGFGVYGLAGSAGGVGGGFFNGSTGDALFAQGGEGYAGDFVGNVDVQGNLSKSGGSFKIDHPLDPANKYLYHSFVESPDMKNIYDGVATLDANGEAIIEMPDWFDALNRDFRYQLTCIGGFAPVYIAGELANNQFKIGGGRAGMRISWQVTGIRQDPWANAHRIPVEEEKEAKLKGFYLHPELYGMPAEKQIEWARHPQMMKTLQQGRGQMKQKQALTASPATERPPVHDPAKSMTLPAKAASSTSAPLARR